MRVICFCQNVNDVSTMGEILVGRTQIFALDEKGLQNALKII